MRRTHTRCSDEDEDEDGNGDDDGADENDAGDDDDDERLVDRSSVPTVHLCRPFVCVDRSSASTVLFYRLILLGPSAPHPTPTTPTIQRARKNKV